MWLNLFFEERGGEKMFDCGEDDYPMTKSIVIVVLLLLVGLPLACCDAKKKAAVVAAKSSVEI